MPTSRPIPRAYTTRCIRRGVVLWLVARAGVMGMNQALPDSVAAPGWQLAPVTVLLLAGMVTFLAHTDARIMRESVFYANLGVPRWYPAGLTGGLVLTLEIFIRLIG